MKISCFCFVSYWVLFFILLDILQVVQVTYLEMCSVSVQYNMFSDILLLGLSLIATSAQG